MNFAIEFKFIRDFALHCYIWLLKQLSVPSECLLFLTLPKAFLQVKKESKLGTLFTNNPNCVNKVGIRGSRTEVSLIFVDQALHVSLMFFRVI